MKRLVIVLTLLCLGFTPLKATGPVPMLHNQDGTIVKDIPGTTKFCSGTGYTCFEPNSSFDVITHSVVYGDHVVCYLDKYFNPTDKPDMCLPLTTKNKRAIQLPSKMASPQTGALRFEN